MSVMLVGILVSGVYEKRTTVTLFRNEPVAVGRNTLTFTRTVFVTDSGEVKSPQDLDASSLADRRAKQAMEVEVASPGGAVWKAYPKLYTNTRTNQMMANPDVKSSLLLDLYVSPQAYDRGRPARIEGTVVALKKGESKTVEGVKLTFLDFSADRSQVSSDRPRVTVTGNFLVTTAKASEEKTARLVMLFGGGAEESSTESPDTPLPGKGRLRLRRVSPNEATCEIELLGLAPGSDLKPATVETLSVDLTTKPLISLVWGGFYVMMAGGLTALLRRARDSRQAALA
jgi:cytochrome c biogenesis factor